MKPIDYNVDRDIGLLYLHFRDWEILDELKPSPDEIVLNKTRNSAFIRTNFAEMLAEHKINHLIATGVGTNICVES